MTTRCAPATISAMLFPLFAVDAPTTATFASGTNRAASFAQLPTTEVGATTRNGANGGCSPSCDRPAVACSACSCMAWAKSARVCTVLPRPISSARMPPRRCCRKNASHRNPSSW